MRKAGWLEHTRIGCGFFIADDGPMLKGRFIASAASEFLTAMHDHFIPLRPAELVRKLGDESSVTIFEREQFRALCELVEATIHNECRSRLSRLKADYAPFDPDDDSAGHEELTEAERK